MHEQEQLAIVQRRAQTLQQALHAFNGEMTAVRPDYGKLTERIAGIDRVIERCFDQPVTVGEKLVNGRAVVTLIEQLFDMVLSGLPDTVDYQPARAILANALTVDFMDGIVCDLTITDDRRALWLGAQ